MPMRALIGRWMLGAALAVGALTMLIRPGGLSKIVALVFAGGAVLLFARRNPGDTTIVAVVLLVVAAGFLGLVLTGNDHLILERYSQ